MTEAERERRAVLNFLRAKGESATASFIHNGRTGFDEGGMRTIERLVLAIEHGEHLAFA